MRLVIALLLAATTASCIGDDDGDGSNYVVVTQIKQAYKEASCTYLANCGYFPDVETCVSAAPTSSVGGSTPIDPDPNVVAAIGAGRVYYNGSNVKECFDALAARSCDKTDQSARVTPAACRNIITGTQHSGDACTIDEECISQQCSGGSNGTSCIMGTCIGDVAPTFELAQLDEQCSSNAQCVPGTYCDNLTQVCTLLKASGSSCQQDTECDYGLGCAGPVGSRTCATLPTVGMTCSLSDNPCRDVGTQCVYDSLTAMYSCKQIGLEGASCAGTPCSNWYPCDSATQLCAPGPSVGESCSFSAACFSADTYCDQSTQVCTALKSNGMTCNDDSECASAYCDVTQASPICGTPNVCF